jgi:hypothetical protein
MGVNGGATGGRERKWAKTGPKSQKAKKKQKKGFPVVGL